MGRCSKEPSQAAAQHTAPPEAEGIKNLIRDRGSNRLKGSSFNHEHYYKRDFQICALHPNAIHNF
jgi:hypothetical protein